MHEPMAGFNWDEGNRAKCRKHGVRVEQIEALFQGQMRVFPDPGHSTRETRYLGIGPVDGRHVLVAFTIRVMAGERFIRPISARFMHTKEVKHYEAQIQDS